MTSVVPQNAHKRSWALAPAIFQVACDLFFDPFRASQTAFFQIPTQVLSDAISLWVRVGWILTLLRGLLIA
jgi:hypothetical protein